jgi:hypothetical protein
MEADPLLAIPYSVLKMWVSLLEPLQVSRLLVDQAWAAWRRDLDAPCGRWNKVTGHIGAVQATLWHMGLQPLRPYEWADPSGEV